jgi:hypothetical protein
MGDPVDPVLDNFKSEMEGMTKELDEIIMDDAAPQQPEPSPEKSISESTPTAESSIAASPASSPDDDDHDAAKEPDTEELRRTQKASSIAELPTLATDAVKSVTGLITTFVKERTAAKAPAPAPAAVAEADGASRDAEKGEGVEPTTEGQEGTDVSEKEKSWVAKATGMSMAMATSTWNRVQPTLSKTAESAKQTAGSAAQNISKTTEFTITTVKDGVVLNEMVEKMYTEFKETDSSTEIQVPAGSTSKIPFFVPKGKAVAWRIMVKTLDVSFAVKLRVQGDGGSTEQELEEARKIQMGSVICGGRKGSDIERYILLEIDNSYSRLRSKTVVYQVLFGDAAEASMAATEAAIKEAEARFEEEERVAAEKAAKEAEKVAEEDAKAKGEAETPAGNAAATTSDRLNAVKGGMMSMWGSLSAAASSATAVTMSAASSATNTVISKAKASGYMPGAAGSEAQTGSVEGAELAEKPSSEATEETEGTSEAEGTSGAGETNEGTEASNAPAPAPSPMPSNETSSVPMETEAEVAGGPAAAEEASEGGAGRPADSPSPMTVTDDEGDNLNLKEMKVAAEDFGGKL